MQNLLASRWITGNQKITEDKMELDAMMMVDGGNKSGNNNNATTTNNNNNNNTNAMRAVSASAEEDDSNNTNENKNISPSLKAVPNFTLRGGIGSGDKKKGATAINNVCYAAALLRLKQTPKSKR